MFTGIELKTPSDQKGCPIFFHHGWHISQPDVLDNTVIRSRFMSTKPSVPYPKFLVVHPGGELAE